MRYQKQIFLIIYFIQLSLSQYNQEGYEINYQQENTSPNTLTQSPVTNIQNDNNKKYKFVYNNNIEAQEDKSELLLTQKKVKSKISDPLSCAVQTTLIKEITCNDTGCTANNAQSVDADISNLSTFSLCLTSQNSVIDLTNINFKMGKTNKQIILQANTIKLNGIGVETDNDFQVDLKVVAQNSIMITSTNFNKFLSISLKSEGVLKLNNTIMQGQTQAYTTSNSLVFENTQLAILGGLDFNSKNDIWLKKFNLTMLNVPIPKKSQTNGNLIVNIISADGNIFLLGQSEMKLANNPVYIQGALINITQTKIQTLKELTLNSVDSVNLIDTQILCSLTYIYNSDAKTTNSKAISIQGSQIISNLRLCKTSCITLKNQKIDLLPTSHVLTSLNTECEVKQYSPLVSLLSDSQNSQFDISQTLKRYKLNQYNDFITLLQTNYTTIIVSMGNIDISSQSAIIGSNIGTYAQSINLSYDSKLSAHGMGCIGTKGAGGGIVDILMRLNLQCGGPGGSYGSLGGSPFSEKDEYNELCSQISSQNLYGNKNEPIFEGSGGGGYVLPPISADIKNNDQHLQYTEQSAGSGGGFIYIETFQLNLYGEVDVSGGQPLKDFSYLGSGSGGSIQIHSAIMIGNGTIRANGGDRNFQGGEGGAGRIKINMTDWEKQTIAQIENMSNNNNVKVEVKQGKSDQKNRQTVVQTNIYDDITENTNINMLGHQNGSFIATSCMPGFQPKNNLFACERCPVGFYKSSYNLEACRPCLNIDNDRLNFSLKNIFDLFICLKQMPEQLQTNGSCVYKCKNSYQSKYVNNIKTCVTNGELFVDSLGGSNVIFFVILLIVSILLNLIILCITKRMNNKKKIQKSIRFSKQVDKNKVRFTLEDLPFHQQRLYIEGENTYNKPWIVNDQVKSEIVKILLQGYKSIDQSDLDQLGLLKQNTPGFQRNSDSGYNHFEGNYSYNYSYDMDLSHDHHHILSNNGGSNDHVHPPTNSYNIWDEIKKACEYTKWEKFVLTVLKFIYPFGYYTQGANYKKQKWKRMKKVMQQFLLDLKAKNCSIGIKFSCSSCFCQAYFDIVDYNKTELQWDIESKMPICLLLQGKGSFMSPFFLNSRDPLFSLLVTYIKSKCDLNYFNYGEVDSRKLSNIEKNMNIFHPMNEENNQDGVVYHKYLEELAYSEEFDMAEVNDIITKQRAKSRAASSLQQSRTSSKDRSLPKRKRSKSRIGSVDEMTFSNQAILSEIKQTECDNGYEDEEEDISYQIISLVECFFNKLNTYSRTICYQLKFDEQHFQQF